MELETTSKRVKCIGPKTKSKILKSKQCNLHLESYARADVSNISKKENYQNSLM